MFIATVTSKTIAVLTAKLSAFTSQPFWFQGKHAADSKQSSVTANWVECLVWFEPHSVLLMQCQIRTEVIPAHFSHCRSRLNSLITVSTLTDPWSDEQMSLNLAEMSSDQEHCWWLSKYFVRKWIIHHISIIKSTNHYRNSSLGKTINHNVLFPCLKL